MMCMGALCVMCVHVCEREYKSVGNEFINVRFESVL